MSDDVLRADPRLRRQTLVVLALAIVIAVTCTYFSLRWLLGVADLSATDVLILRMRSMIGLAVAGCAACLALLAGYSARKGQRALRFQQWPLPAARVLRDTPIRRGRTAQRIGRLLQVSAVVLALLAVATGAVSWRLLMLS